MGVLEEAGLGTLLIDLLEEDEAQDTRMVFDIELLADRLRAVTDWLGNDPESRGLCLGYFGASTGAGAALVAAARQPERIGAVVSRGGRPDPARDALVEVGAPTLLLVGTRDLDVLEPNRRAQALLRCPKELIIIPGATRLFPEPGAIEHVARLARVWFLRYLAPDSRTRRDPSKPIGCG